MENFGTYLKIVTYNKGIRAVSMADGTGLSPSAFTKYFKGSLPERQVFERILKYLSPMISHAEEIKLIDLYLEGMTGFDMGHSREDSLNAFELLILNKVRQLTPRQQTRVMGLLDQMLTDNLDEMAEQAAESRRHTSRTSLDTPAVRRRRR